MTREQAISMIQYLIQTEVKWPGTEDTVEALEMALTALRKEKTGGWISVKDRLPEAHGHILTCYARDGTGAGGATNPGVGICYYGGYFGEKAEFLGTLKDETVTHWMPLPEPPEEV